MLLEVNKLSKSYAGRLVVRDFTFAVSPGEIVIILGPSGCGKTTLLRMIAGLESPDSGSVFIGGKAIDNLPPDKRDVALIFQRPVLLPNRTVGENLSYPLLCRTGSRIILHRWSHMPVSTRNAAESMASNLEVSELIHRYPETLSGGELQRITLGRAILKDSSVLLLDEPLASIDIQLRHRLRFQILAWRDEARIRGRGAFLYVTHDQEDALTLGDRIGIMKDGRLLQIDIAEKMLEEPKNRYVAEYLGWPPMNFIETRILKVEENRILLDLGKTPYFIPAKRLCNAHLMAEGMEVAIGFRPRQTILVSNGGIVCRILRHKTIDGQTTILAVSEKGMLSAIIDGIIPKSGELISVLPNPEKIFLFDAKDSDHQRL